MEKLDAYYTLSVHQKIGLKEAFMNDESFRNYRLLMALWNFKVAIEYFLTDDLSVIPTV